MKKYYQLITALSFIAISHFAKGQGCSDAGFCTINSLKPKTSDTTSVNQNNQMKFGISNGKADKSVNIESSYLEYNKRINKNFGFDLKLSYLSQIGPLAKSSGLSDIYLNTNFTGVKNALFTFGIKFPLNDGNKMKGGLSLPMDYQNSLGTTDLIVGFSYEVKRIRFTTALQQPLSQNNNSFLSTDYPVNSAFRQFQSTNKYVRKGDVLFRVSYPVISKEKLKITPSLLPIYHLSNDLFTDINGKEQKIVGSQGLTFNGNIFMEYSINESNQIELSFGTPFIARASRPDGLTRKYVLTLEYKLKF